MTVPIASSLGATKSVLGLLPLLLLLLSSTAETNAQVNSTSKICSSSTNIFTVRVDLHVSERGYFVFEECGLDWINPTIGLEFGITYTFVQKDRSNFWHPLDFSYFPDAHHVGADLLSPNVDPTTHKNTNNSCALNMTCPAPMHFLNDGYLGTYSNTDQVPPITVNENDTGLLDYEEFFFQGLAQWTGFGTFSIKLKFDRQQYNDQDIFYYCRIHQFMAGRIKLLSNGQPVNAKDTPSMYFQMEHPGTFDQMCGTYDLDAYQLPNPQCPTKFVCDVDPRMTNFASCIDAMNCHMMIGMTTKATSNSEIALFIHQMIPHHQNAVNMAKALLKAGFLPCDDLTDVEDPYCIMQEVLYGIVNRQNYEIGVMNHILAVLNMPPTDDCQVMVPDQSQSSWAPPDGVAAAIFGAAAHLF